MTFQASLTQKISGVIDEYSDKIPWSWEVEKKGKFPLIVWEIPRIDSKKKRRKRKLAMTVHREGECLQLQGRIDTNAMFVVCIYIYTCVLVVLEQRYKFAFMHDTYIHIVACV